MKNVKAAYFILDEREGEYLDSDPDLIEALLLASILCLRRISLN